MNILVVDGPARGKMYDTKATRFLAMADMMMPVDVSADVETVTYHVHKYYIAGRLIRLASTQLLPESIRDSDVFELIVSDKAKAAAE